MPRIRSRHTCQLTGQEVNEPKGEAAKDAIRERWQINSAAAFPSAAPIPLRIIPSPSWNTTCKGANYSLAFLHVRTKAANACRTHWRWAKATDGNKARGAEARATGSGSGCGCAWGRDRLATCSDFGLGTVAVSTANKQRSCFCFCHTVRHVLQHNQLQWRTPLSWKLHAMSRPSS